MSCVQKWSKIARVQPHVACCAFTHGLIGKWTYFPDVSDLLEPLETTITGEFIPTITGQSVGELERKLFSLPVRLVWLALQRLLALSLMHLNLLHLLCPSQIIQQWNNFDPTVLMINIR